jgi:hypothetical protein
MHDRSFSSTLLRSLSASLLLALAAAGQLSVSSCGGGADVPDAGSNSTLDKAPLPHHDAGHTDAGETVPPEDADSDASSVADAGPHDAEDDREEVAAACESASAAISQVGACGSCVASSPSCSPFWTQCLCIPGCVSVLACKVAGAGCDGVDAGSSANDQASAVSACGTFNCAGPCPGL